MQRQSKLTSLMAPLAWSVLAFFAANLVQAEDDPVLKTESSAAPDRSAAKRADTLHANAAIRDVSFLCL